ncbi:hypothetical protein SO802_027040 [Lithocarpus litseifolius]|uniref:Ribosomal protein L20 n=1 Tax=Lithocarpus litseifolius TaxID=425828 RepID=A0AAW2C737_9ROSI
MQATWRVEEAISGERRRRWSLQTRGDGDGLIGEGALICEGEGGGSGRATNGLVGSPEGMPTTSQKQLVKPSSRKLYHAAENFTALQKVLKHNKRFYSTAGSFTAQQKSRFCGRNWRKVHSTAKAKDKLTLQRLPLDFGLNVCAQTNSGRMVLWSLFRKALDPTSFLEKA